MAWEPDYVTDEELKDFIRINNLDNMDDGQIALAIPAASRAIDGHCKRQFGLVDTPETRKYTAIPGLYGWVCYIDDLMTETGLAIVIDGVTITTGYHLTPINASFKGRPWTKLEPARTSSIAASLDRYAVEITARWGWTTVPDTIKEATLLQASRFTSRRDSPHGIAGSPSEGSEVRLLDKLDVDVINMLGDGPPYVRKRGQY
jgi:hypothetical protein